MAMQIAKLQDEFGNSDLIEIMLSIENLLPPHVCGLARVSAVKLRAKDF